MQIKNAAFWSPTHTPESESLQGWDLGIWDVNRTPGVPTHTEVDKPLSQGLFPHWPGPRKRPDAEALR